MYVSACKKQNFSVKVIAVPRKLSDHHLIEINLIKYPNGIETSTKDNYQANTVAKEETETTRGKHFVLP